MISNIIKNITSFYTKINETFINYVNILDEDLESYINKLSYYAFIEGFYSFDKPCSKSSYKISSAN